MKPKVAILISDGANCDQELHYAFEKFGSSPDLVHVNELRSKGKNLKDYQILAIPGGFSYGDDVVSGKILAVELISFLKDQLQTFIDKKGIVLGVCNGFQVLIRTGLLPFTNLAHMDATLAQNEKGHFECRWIKLKSVKSKCLFLHESDQIFEMCVNHGEGMLFASPEVIKKIEDENLVVYRYVDDNGKQTQNYPQNPSGSTNAIAAICDPTGRILGIMPHPEKFIDTTQHPNWRRQKFTEPHGAHLFKEMIRFVKSQ